MAVWPSVRCWNHRSVHFLSISTYSYSTQRNMQVNHRGRHSHITEFMNLKKSLIPSMGVGHGCLVSPFIYIYIYFPFIFFYITNRTDFSLIVFSFTSPQNQWLFLVPLKGGRWHIIPQLAVYTTYISLVYCLLGGYMLPTTF